MADEVDTIFESDIKAWREGNWHFVSINGKIVYRRYTRDRAFKFAEVVFYENRSPRYPRTLKTLDRVELGGAWTKTRHNSNRLRVPIEKR